MKGIFGAFSFEVSSNIASRPSDILVGEIEKRSKRIEKVSCNGFSIPNSVLTKLAESFLILCRFVVIVLTWLCWQFSSSIMVLFSMMINRKCSKGKTAMIVTKLAMVPKGRLKTSGFKATLIEAKMKGMQKLPISDPRIHLKNKVLFLKYSPKATIRKISFAISP